MDAIDSKRMECLSLYLDMKRARYGNMPVPMPDIPSNVGGLGRFANQVRNAIKVLRDRPVILPSAPAIFSAHPWKVTSNGDDTVRVAEGRAHHWKIGESDEGAALDNPVSFEGQSSLSVTTSGTSYIYAKMPIASAQVAGGTSNRQLTGTVTVENETDLPTAIDATNDVYLLLATVEKTDGIVAITEQHLSHNPVVSIQDSEGAAASTHPWKATANGDDTISVAAGVMYGFIPYADSAGGTTSSAAKFFAPFVADYKKFAGASIQITESSGYIYAKCDLTYDTEGFEGGGDYDVTQQLYRPSEVASLFFSDLAPTALDPSSDDFGSAKDVYIPVAEVSLSGGVASVDYQILTHNPMIQLDDVEVAAN